MCKRCSVKPAVFLHLKLSHIYDTWLIQRFMHSLLHSSFHNSIADHITPSQNYLLLLGCSCQLSYKELCPQTVLGDLWWFVCVWRHTCPKWQPRVKNKQVTSKEDKAFIPDSHLSPTLRPAWLETLTEQQTLRVAHPAMSIYSCRVGSQLWHMDNSVFLW